MLESRLENPSPVAAVLQMVREPMLVLDGTLRIKQASPMFFTQFGVSPEDVLDQALPLLDHGAWDIPGLAAMLHGVVASGKAVEDYRVEADFPHVGRRTLLLSARPLDDTGTPLVMLAVDDITQRGQTGLVRHGQWLATMLTSIGDAVIATDVKGDITFMNPTAQRLTGWRAEDALGRPLPEVFHVINEESRAPVESPVTRALQTGRVVGLANHTLLVARDQTEHSIDDSAAPIRDDAGHVLGVVLVFHDIDGRRAGERAQARLAAIVESSDDAIAAKDLNGIITAWNTGAERLFGYASQEAVGRSIMMIIPPERKQEELEVLAKIRRGERIDHFETVRQRKDGTRVEISLTVSPIRNSRGDIIGASKIARDITERKRIEAELQSHLAGEQALRQEAENANRSKDLFLATLSHELRTPLNAIVGWIRILQSPGCTPEDLREGLEIIERNSRAQAQLIDDVLDTSRIVSGKLKLNMQMCDYAAVISAAVDTVRPAASAKEMRLETRLDPAALAGVCDPGRLQQVIWNLLSNAIKFTPRGGHIVVALSRDGSNTRIEVIDNGMGITPEFLPYVFDRFRQADSSTRRKFGGLGLGLSIVKQLVEMHGGTVRAESAGEGRGAAFTVELPVAAIQVIPDTVDPRAEEEHATPSAQRPHSPRLDGLRVLVVDDQPDARRLVGRILSDFGAQVVTVGSTAEALQAIQRQPPQILVSDIAMPEEDGFDLIRQIRSKGLDARALPAVALSAFADKNHARAAMLAGYQMHLAKPADPRDLLAVVASLTGRTGSAREV